MFFSIFFGRKKTFSRWMNFGKLKLLKNFSFCRTVNLRFEATLKLLLKYIAIVPLTVGQREIPRTFMFEGEVNH